MGGVPLALLIGVAAHDRLLERMAARAGVPAISQVTSVVAALRHLGVRNAALANKWSEKMNVSLGEFLARDGIAVAGTANRSMAPKDFQRMSTKNSMELAYELGRTALESLPQADGLYIGGGAWLSLPVTQRLETEFGKPVVCNQSAMQWKVLRMLGVWEPLLGHGRLLGGD
jgi:maleate isomerase